MEPLPEELEARADARAAEGDYAAAVALREQAFAAWRAQGDVRRAAYLAAYHLAFDHVALYGDDAVAGGWLARGVRLAEEAGDCPERGWVALAQVLAAGDPAERAGHLAEAVALAKRFGDQDLAFDAMAYAGVALVEQGQVEAGMRQLDEAAAAVRSGEVRSRVTAGEILCKMMVACELTLDVRRAEQWVPFGAGFAGQPQVAWASAICRTHYGGILVAAGHWPEAETELHGSLGEYDASYRALRSAAVVRLAELRSRQGRLEEAALLLAGYEGDAYAARPLARLHLARGETELAAAVLRRQLRTTGVGLAAVPLLALLVEVELAAGRPEESREVTAELAALAAAGPVASVQGYAAYAQGLAGSGDRVGWLEAAVAAFAEARLPLEEARARLALSRELAGPHPTVAAADAAAALAAFERLGAAGEVDAAAALVRSLGGRARTGAKRVGNLSDREREVLALLAQGLSNPEIAARLFISPKTAGHHVSNVLAKLGVRNRAEAAAWAAAQGHDRAR